MNATPPARLRADMHVHTRHSRWRHLRLIHPRDSYSLPIDVYRRALARGMDLVAITDHDSIEGALRLLEEPRVDASRVIVGEEVECTFPDTGQWVHVNVYGLDERDHAALQALRGDVREVVAFCRERGLLHALNHPFQSFLFQKTPARYAWDILGLFSHVEGLNGSLPLHQDLAVAELCALGGRAGRPLVRIGGSDAHTLARVGTAWTEAAASDAASFLRALRDGRCAISGSNVSTLGLVGEVYRNVGTYYARLYTGRGEGRTVLKYAQDVLCASACLPFAAGGLPATITLCSQIRQRSVSASVSKALRAVRDLAPEPRTSATGSEPCASEA
jgi:hypothetical protein